MVGVTLYESNQMGFVKNTNKTASIIGVPFHGGQPKKGTDLTPNWIRKAGLVPAVEALGWKVDYDQDVLVDPLSTSEMVGNLKNPMWVGEVCKRAHDAIFARASEDNFCLSIGGDHSIAAGTIAGIMKANPDTCIIWVDAHADINTPEISPSGNIHGMPVALLMGLVKDAPGFEWLQPCLPMDRIAYIGLRDVDDGERDLLQKHGIAAYSMMDLDRYGIAKVLDMALDRINTNRDRPVHLSFDIDALDPFYAPATGTAVPGGMTLREGRYIAEALSQSGLLTSMDIVEVNPALSDPQRAGDTINSALVLIQAAMGRALR